LLSNQQALTRTRPKMLIKGHMSSCRLMGYVLFRWSTNTPRHKNSSLRFWRRGVCNDIKDRHKKGACVLVSNTSIGAWFEDSHQDLWILYWRVCSRQHFATCKTTFFVNQHSMEIWESLPPTHLHVKNPCWSIKCLVFIP
jgi:hypothetical protein